MSTIPAPADQKDRFVRLQLGVDSLIELGDPDDPATYDARDRPDPFGDRLDPYLCGPNDEYLAFGRMWWRYLTSGAIHYVSDTTRPLLEPHAVPSLSLGACVHGMGRVLLHFSQLDDVEFAKTVGGMVGARLLALAESSDPNMSTSGYDFVSWPQSLPAPGPAPVNTFLHSRRRALASANFTLLAGGSWVPLENVNHRYVLRLARIQDAIEDLRTTTNPYDNHWNPTARLDAVTEVGPAWATFYNSAVAHAVGGPQGAARLEDIETKFDADVCLAGLKEVRKRLKKMDPAHRPRAYASIDYYDFVFDPYADEVRDLETAR